MQILFGNKEVNVSLHVDMVGRIKPSSFWFKNIQRGLLLLLMNKHRYCSQREQEPYFQVVLGRHKAPSNAKPFPMCFCKLQIRFCGIPSQVMRGVQSLKHKWERQCDLVSYTEWVPSLASGYGYLKDLRKSLTRKWMGSRYKTRIRNRQEKWLASGRESSQKVSFFQARST